MARIAGVSQSMSRGRQSSRQNNEHNYRYVLYRRWSDSDAPLAVFIGPQSQYGGAGFRRSDRTKKCWMWASTRGYARFAMLNLFAWREPYPRRLFAHGRDAVGPRTIRSFERPPTRPPLLSRLGATAAHTNCGSAQRNGDSVTPRRSDYRPPPRAHGTWQSSPPPVLTQDDHVAAVELALNHVVTFAVTRCERGAGEYRQ